MEEESKQLYRRAQMTGQARAVKILFTSSCFTTEFFLSYRAAGMTDDPPTPCRSVRLITSQSSTFYVSLARVFPSSFRSPYLSLPQYIRPQHFPHSVSSSLLITCQCQFNSLSVIFLEACAILIVPRMCSFVILS